MGAVYVCEVCSTWWWVCDMHGCGAVLWFCGHITGWWLVVGGLCVVQVYFWVVGACDTGAVLGVWLLGWAVGTDTLGLHPRPIT